jgi:hypothetical protein
MAQNNEEMKHTISVDNVNPAVVQPPTWTMTTKDPLFNGITI